MSSPFFLSDRFLGEEYLVPNRSDVSAPDGADLLAFMVDDAIPVIETYKETHLVISARFSDLADNVRIRIIYFIETDPNNGISDESGIQQAMVVPPGPRPKFDSSNYLVAGQSEEILINATKNIGVSGTDSPPEPRFIGDDVFIPMRGTKFAKIKVESISGNVTFLVGRI